jgi:hypothetical protein
MRRKYKKDSSMPMGGWGSVQSGRGGLRFWIALWRFICGLQKIKNGSRFLDRKGGILLLSRVPRKVTSS